MSWRLRPRDTTAAECEVNAWAWRPVLALLERDGRLDPALVEALGYNDLVEVSESDAVTIAEVLDAEIGRRGGATTSDERRDFRRGDLSANYGADADTLRRLSDFARRSAGFTAG